MQNIDKLSREKIISIISALFPDAKVYLFGSRARGTNSQWSDIDIALDSGKKISFVDIGEAQDVMSALNIPYKVDIVDVYSVSEDMQKLILQEGILWEITSHSKSHTQLL